LIRTCVALFAVLLPSAAIAQEGLGLDLTEEPRKKEEQKKEREKKEAPPEQTPAAGISERDHPLSTKPGEGLVVERDTTQEDRVKSVQRKVYLKKHRLELAPFVTVSLNDPYYSKVGGALRGAYYLADTLAIAARFSLMEVIPTDDVRAAKRNFQSRIFASVPQWSAMSDIEWSPIYGKVSIFNSILHFDAYVLTGLGAVKTETSSQPGRGLNVAVDLGIGARFVAKDYLAVNVALVDTAYNDQPTGTTKAAIQNLVMLYAGVSVFLPLKSTGREAE
jgi:outer membrane beta-barrel protein